jgi:hypothetical protein
MEISLHRERPSIDNWIPRVCKHDGHSRVPGVLTAVADQLEDQWDRFIPSEIAGDRVTYMQERGFSQAVHGCVNLINKMQEHRHDSALEETQGWSYSVN